MACNIPAAAQDKPADNMQFVIEKMRADKKLFISNVMKLTEKEAKGFWPLYDDYQNELFLLRKKTGNLINKYSAVYGNINNDNARGLLNEYIEIEALRPELLKSFLPRFRKVISDIKILRYYQVENKINSAILYEIAGSIPVMPEGN
jgi:hypothetical protein